MSRRIPFDVDTLRADIEAGRTNLSIADEYDCSLVAVRAMMRREGIVRPERHIPARHPELVDREWFQTEYVDTQRSRAGLACQFGCGSTTIRDDLALVGIAMCGSLTDSMPPELGDRDWLAAADADRSAEAIARELGVGATAVRRAMRKLGVEVDTNRSR